MQEKYHFVGIGGSGMKSLAYFTSLSEADVSGSDRAYHPTLAKNKVFNKLQANNIKLTPQNGEGINSQTKCVVISTAIENDNLDLKQAKFLKIPLVSRAKFLAGFFNKRKGIAITGTNGKTTVAGMLSFALANLRQNPSYVLGGEIINYKNQGFKACAQLGTSKLMVIEADESDGSLKEYTPSIGIINNISKDHKEVKELLRLFNKFTNSSQELIIINQDCPLSKKIKLPPNKNLLSFGIEKKADLQGKNLKLYPFYSIFRVKGCSFKINLPGKHNVLNALAVIAVLRYLNFELKQISQVLKKFKGMQRRLELISEVKGIKVIDDFAHNPEKIKAALTTAKKMGQRILSVFQPHGFAPTIFLKKEYITVFKEHLRNKDFLYMPEVYYAGGTVSRSISSLDLIKEISKKRKNVFFVQQRKDIISKIIDIAHRKDVILLMGARDPSLPAFAKKIKAGLKQ